ncbi:MAG: hypothetical protein J6W37_01210 [Bacteroidales bacterium]|nr:hypothetical protein [Bacteroidales bacterium]
MGGFCILNGEIEKISSLKSAPIFVLNDAEKEDIRLYDTKPLCIGLHIQNLIARLQQKNVSIPEKFTKERIDRYVSRLLNVNKVFRGGVCTLLVFWQQFPACTQPQFCIFIEPLERVKFSFNDVGLKLGYQEIYSERQPYVPISVCASNDGNVDNFDVLCRLDRLGHSYTTNRGDLILMKGDEIHVCENLLPFTTYFTEYLARNKWKVVKHLHFGGKDIYDSSEVLLCSSFVGLQWVSHVYSPMSVSDAHVYGFRYAKELFFEMERAIEMM